MTLLMIYFIDFIVCLFVQDTWLYSKCHFNIYRHAVHCMSRKIMYTFIISQSEQKVSKSFVSDCVGEAGGH